MPGIFAPLSAVRQGAFGGGGNGDGDHFVKLSFPQIQNHCRQCEGQTVSNEGQQGLCHMIKEEEYFKRTAQNYLLLADKKNG